MAPKDFLGYKLSESARDSLRRFHGHDVTIVGSVNTSVGSTGLRASEAYVRHPDRSAGYEHTIDGVTWIPRERSIFANSYGGHISDR